jgi:ABC-type multidrug transport system ATPase subunit
MVLDALDVINAVDLTVEFKVGVKRRKLRALDHLSLDIREGDFFALLGQNGAGKSTAMYCFLGLIRPTSGSIRIWGEPPRAGASIFRRISYLPEDPQYHLYLTVGEALDYYATLSHSSMSAAKKTALLERLGIAEFRDLRLSKCSKGMKQKLGIAQALVNEPRLMFLDEPMRGLDPIAVKTFRDLLTDLNRQGTTIVMSSHVMAEVERVATRAAVIDRGRLVALDRIDNLMRLDREVYEVEFSAGGAEPSFITVDRRTDGSVEGRIAATDFDAFVAFTQAEGRRVLTCSLKRSSLEDAYFSILGRTGELEHEREP